MGTYEPPPGTPPPEREPMDISWRGIAIGIGLIALLAFGYLQSANYRAPTIVFRRSPKDRVVYVVQKGAADSVPARQAPAGATGASGAELQPALSESKPSDSRPAETEAPARVVPEATVVAASSNTPAPAPSPRAPSAPKPETVGEAAHRCLAVTAAFPDSMSFSAGSPAYWAEVTAINRCPFDIPGEAVAFEVAAYSQYGGMAGAASGSFVGTIAGGDTIKATVGFNGDPARVSNFVVKLR